jgi:hypothetical protein
MRDSDVLELLDDDEDDDEDEADETEEVDEADEETTVEAMRPPGCDDDDEGDCWAC